MSVYDKFNLNKINELKDEIAEAFIQVYGEKHRDLIKERIDRINFIYYISKKDFSRYLTDLSNDNILELTDEFSKSMGIENPSAKKEDDMDWFSTFFDNLNSQILDSNSKSNDIFKVCFDKQEYSRERYPDVLKLFSEEYFSDFSEDFKNKIIKQRVDILNYFGANVNEENYQESIDSGLLDEVLQKVSKLQEVIRELDNKRDAFLEEHKQEFMEKEKDDKIESDLRDEYEARLFDEVFSSLPEQFQTVIKQEGEIDFGLRKYGFPYSLSGESLVGFFSSENNDILKNETDSIKIKEIKEGRIDFFKRNGIDLGNDYEQYINNPKALSLIPEQDIIDKIANLSKHYYEKFQIETIKNTGSYQENLDKISSLGCLEDIYNATSVYHNMIYVSPSIVEKPDGSIDDLPVVFLPSILKYGVWYKCSDVAIIHEIGHAIEEELVKKDDGTYLHKTGFEFLRVNRKEDETEEDLEKPNQIKREYEVLNEAIHQQLSIEVTDILHAKGIFIEDSPENFKTKGSMPRYERAFSVISPFFKEYRQLMIDAMLSEKGRREFEELPIYSQFLKINSLSREFDSLATDHVVIDYKMKKSTPETIRYKEIINEVLELTNQAKLLNSAILESTGLEFQEILSAKDIIAGSVRLNPKEKDDFRGEEI